MSDDLHFDTHTRQSFDRYEAEVPPGMWDRIAAERRKRKPGGGWFTWSGRAGILLLLSGLFITAGLTWWWHHGDTVVAAAPVTPVPQSPSAGQQTSPSATPVSPASSPTNAAPRTNTLTHPGNTASNANTDNHSTSAATNTNNTNTIADISTSPGADHDIVSPSRTKLPRILPARSGTPVYSPLLHNTRRTVAGQEGGQPGRGAKSNTDIINAMGSNNSISNEEPLADTDNGQVQNTGNNNGWIGEKMTGGVDKALRIAPEPAGFRNRIMPNVALPGCPKIEDDAAANKTYVEFYAGPDMGTRTLRSLTDTASIGYLRKRKESAGFQSAFSIGLRYTRVFNNGMSLRSGLNYSQINEKFSYTNPNDIRYIIVITPRQVTQPNGTVITVYDSLRYVQTGTRKKITYNRYRSIDIPLQMGYEFGNGRLHTNISIGAIINLYSWQKGDVLDANGEPVNITTGKSTSAYGFKTNIGAGFLSSVSLYYRLTNRWHLMAEPYFRYNFSPMSKETLNLTQKYNTIGLRLGIRLDL